MPVLSVTALYVVLDGMCGVTSGALKGCGRQPILAPIVIASYYFIGLPTSCSLAFHHHLGTVGLAWGSTIGTGMHCLMFSTLVLTTSWPLQAQRAHARAPAKMALHNEADETCDACAGG